MMLHILFNLNFAESTILFEFRWRFQIRTIFVYSKFQMTVYYNHLARMLTFFNFPFKFLKNAILLIIEKMFILVLLES